MSDASTRFTPGRWTRHLRAAAVVCLAIPLHAHAQAVPDPTERTRAAAAGAASAGSARWQLQSTLIAADRRVASINDEVVGIGDRIGDAEVVEILPYAVKLRAGGRIIELRLDTGDDPKSGERG